MIKTYRFFPLVCLFVLSFYGSPVTAQDPIQSIRDLKQGILIVRFPGFKAKIDTLTSMLARVDDGSSKKRLQNLLNEAFYERDSIRADYIEAFQNYYDFSRVHYFMDYEARDLPNAHFFSLDGSPVSYRAITGLPHFYLHFEKTQESKIDALVIYDQNMKRLSRPFPNNFSRGGLSFLFAKVMDQKFADGRVKKMNKKLHRFWETVN